MLILENALVIKIYKITIKCYYILSKVTKIADISAAWLAGNGKTCDFMIIILDYPVGKQRKNL